MFWAGWSTVASPFPFSGVAAVVVTVNQAGPELSGCGHLVMCQGVMAGGAAKVSPLGVVRSRRALKVGWSVEDPLSLGSYADGAFDAVDELQADCLEDGSGKMSQCICLPISV